MIRPVSRSLVGPWLAGNEDWRSNWCCGVAALAATDDGLAGKHAGEQARESGNFDDRKAGLVTLRRACPSSSPRCPVAYYSNDAISISGKTGSGKTGSGKTGGMVVREFILMQHDQRNAGARYASGGAAAETHPAGGYTTGGMFEAKRNQSGAAAWL